MNQEEAAAELLKRKRTRASIASWFPKAEELPKFLRELGPTELRLLINFVAIISGHGDLRQRVRQESTLLDMPGLTDRIQ